MDSARPEPSRPRTTPRATGTAAPRPAAADRAGTAHHVVVLDEQDLDVDVERVGRLTRHVLDRLDVPTELEVSVTCVDVERITALNEAHLGGHGPTDVLAFPIDDVTDVAAGVPGLLGDVVVCPRMAYKQAPAHGRGPDDEVDLLVVHGILHLLGHDHAEPDERARMFSLTDDLLADFTGATAEDDGPS